MCDGTLLAFEKILASRGDRTRDRLSFEGFYHPEKLKEITPVISFNNSG